MRVYEYEDEEGAWWFVPQRELWAWLKAENRAWRSWLQAERRWHGPKSVVPNRVARRRMSKDWKRIEMGKV